MVAAEALCKSLYSKYNEKGRKNIYYKLVIYFLMRGPEKQLTRTRIIISKAFLYLENGEWTDHICMRVSRMTEWGVRTLSLCK